MDSTLYANYLNILKHELVPALGCTEPIAIAYAAAKARQVLGEFPEQVEMHLSGNIIKNVKGVTVPNSGGLKGIDVAAVLGIVGGNADRALEVLSEVSPEDISRTRELISQKICSCSLVENVDNLFITAIVTSGKHSASVTIEHQHTNITKITKDGEIILDNPYRSTEAAAIAVFYGIIVSAFVYRNMGWKDFIHVLSASASSTASILFLVANAHIFSYLLSSEQIPQKLAILMTSLTTNPTMIMFLIMIVLLIAGCFLDNAVAVILLTPIFVNVVQAMNIDICYFGVFLVFVLAIGQVTPPVGLCLFVACDIGKVSIEKISREVLPYVGGLIVTAILLVLFPQIVTWLPSLTKMA